MCEGHTYTHTGSRSETESALCDSVDIPHRPGERRASEPVDNLRPGYKIFMLHSWVPMGEDVGACSPALISLSVLFVWRRLLILSWRSKKDGVRSERISLPMSLVCFDFSFFIIIIILYLVLCDAFERPSHAWCQ